MTAAVWVFLSVFAGWQINRSLLEDPVRLISRMGSEKTAGPFCQSPLAVLLLRLSLAASVGLLAVTWLTYGLASLLNSLLPVTIHPLLPANLLVLSFLAVWAGIYLYRQRANLFSTWPGLIRSLQRRSGAYAFAVLLVWIVFAWWLMGSTFFRLGSQIHAGYSVFSDFAPHTALVSSFSQGRNWPTVYPHFPNDGIAYHFLFFFLCGNLNFLGLPLDWAINLPSAIALVTFCLLLGFLAVRLTGRTATFLLAPLMLFLRSSTAFFTHLSDLAKNLGAGPAAWGGILQTLWKQASFIGSTPRDEWGLWGINVYANQRHFLFGMSLLLSVLLLILPDLQAGLGRSGLRKWAHPDSWRVQDGADKRRIALVLLICLLLPYWHGSVLVSLLLVLLPISLFAANRLGFVLIAAGSVLSALLQSTLFSGQAMRVIQPSIYFGFLAADRSPSGALTYLLMVTGLALPLLAIAFWLPGWRRKILISSFMLPLVFAFTVSLTPDVTVNHKYIITALALANIYLSDLLVRLWSGPERNRQTRLQEPGCNRPDGSVSPKNHRLTIISRSLAFLLGALLMVTGLQECRIVRNINQNTVSLDLASPLVRWVREQTRPDDIFVSAPWHYNTFFLSGRSIWFGHSYYAWSAGHDTSRRYDQVRQLLTAFGGDLAAVHNLIQEEQLDFLIVDDTLRRHEDLAVDETFFSEYFRLAATFPSLGNMNIYDLKSAP